VTKAIIDPDLSVSDGRRPSTNWRRTVLGGYAIIFGAVGSFAAWGAVARLDGAVIAPGVLSTEGSRKTIQHLEGGIVQEILVRDGDRVAANQLLVRLDPTRIDTQGDLYNNQLAILLAQEARLIAEFEGRDELVFPVAVVARQNEPAVAPVIADQSRLFESKRTAVLRDSDIAESLMQQSRKEAEQLGIDIEANRGMLKQVDAELGQLRPLYQRQLVPTTRVAPLERERVRLQGVIDGGAVQIKRLADRLSELDLRKQQVRQQYRQEASTALQDVRKLLTDVRQQVLLVSDSQKRGEIRAPTGGTVQQMRYFTVGGVIKPGDAILDIAPDNEELVIKAKIDVNDIDRVRIGNKAEVKFPSFGYWNYKPISGVLRSVTRDRISEDSGRVVYFAADVVVDKETLPADISGKLSAGMAADVMLVTGERTVTEYLLGPLVKRWNASLRER
jgi:HlyD family type I secretion membrane fusion protein